MLHRGGVEVFPGVAYQINKSCVLCGECVPVCPARAIHEHLFGYIIDIHGCNECDECLDICPVDAIGPAVKRESRPPLNENAQAL